MDEMIEEHQIGENENDMEMTVFGETNRKVSVFDRFKLSNLNIAQRIADALIITFSVVVCVRDISDIVVIVPFMVPLLFAINKWIRPKNAVYFGLLLLVVTILIDDIDAGLGSIVVVLPIAALVHHFSKPKWHGNVSNMSGTEFEYWCAAMLKKNMGFVSAKVTTASNDYGADIIGKDKKGRKWVIQCKRYNGSVGNSAVQEVVAAKAHYRAERAAVMTNSTLTRNARKLADENGVEIFENLGD